MRKVAIRFKFQNIFQYFSMSCSHTCFDLQENECSVKMDVLSPMTFLQTFSFNVAKLPDGMYYEFPSVQ